MSFNKSEQAKRAAEFAKAQLAQGAKPVPKAVIPVSVPTQVARQVQKEMLELQDRLAASQKPKCGNCGKCKCPKKPRLQPYQALPFKNSIGQLLDVGDKVICVAEGNNHAITVKTGTYVGYREGYRGSVGTILVEVLEKQHAWVVNGKRFNSVTPGAKYSEITVSRVRAYPGKRVYAVA